MLRTAVRILGRVEDARDIRQAILLKIWQGEMRLPEDAHIRPWLTRCVINRSISFLRSQKRRRQRERISASNQQQLYYPQVSKDDQYNEHFDLQFALSHLTPEQRAMVSLRFDEEMTIREIATTLKKPHSTIQSRLNIAIRALKLALTKLPNSKENSG